MANTYQWSMNSMDSYPTYAGQTDCVFNVAWVCSATDGVNNTATYGVVAIPYIAEDQYIPYADLTFDHVMTWVNDELGADGIAAAQATCDQQLAAIANPPQQSLPLPWG